MTKGFLKSNQNKSKIILTLIFASSGPLLESDTLVPCFSLCLYVFITPQRKALLFYGQSKKGKKIYSGVYTLYTYMGVAVKSLDKYKVHFQTKAIFLFKLIPGVSVHVLF